MVRNVVGKWQKKGSCSICCTPAEQVRQLLVNPHCWPAPACSPLQAATAGNDRELFKQFSTLNTQLSRQVHLRGLLRFRTTAQVRREAQEHTCQHDIADPMKSR